MVRTGIGLMGVMMMVMPCTVFVMVPLLRNDVPFAIFAGLWSVAAVILIVGTFPTVPERLILHANARALRALRRRFASRLNADERDAIDTALAYSRLVDEEG